MNSNNPISVKSKWIVASFLSLALGCLPFALGSTSGGGAVDVNVFVNLSKKLVPSVVNISTLSKAQGPNPRSGQEDLYRKFFEDFFQGQGPGRSGPRMPEENDEGGGSGAPRALSLGTGFIIDASGLILTNNHVVAGADEIKINFTEEENETSTDGQVVGRDAELDLALIKVETTRKLIPAVLGDSDALEVGEYVGAIGNPFGQGHSVTHGIISAKGRKSPDFILANYLQTDAPINPGNSGGPLVNLKGEVIGINNAIDQRAQGIGFAIPINLVKSVLPQLKSKGSVARGYIGILVNQLSPDVAKKIGAPPDLRACFVTHVYPGDPADKAGVKSYDVILSLNGKKIASPNELVNVVTSTPVDNSVPLVVTRNGKEITLSIRIGLRPGEGVDKLSPKKGKPKKNSAYDLSGIGAEDLTAETAKDLGAPEKTKGAVVVELKYGSPGGESGLLRGDIIVEVDRHAIKSADQFYSSIKQKRSYLVRVRRNDPQGREAFQVIVLDLK